MGAVKLELRCPQSVHGIAVDPEPDWNFDALSSELNSLEQKLNVSSMFPVPFTKTKSRVFSNGKSVGRSPRAFVMRVSDDEMEDMDNEGEEANNQILALGKRFICDEIHLSDSEGSEDESALEAEYLLMDKVGPVEGAMYELADEHDLEVKEEIRNQISALEADLMSEGEKSTSALGRVKKYIDARREMDRRHDIQYQRKIAEALDTHLTAIQRDHELRSQIEERRIRSDAAFEEAKRKEKALQEEKLRQEKEKAKAEAEAKHRAEEARRAALEAERRAAKEAAERKATENAKKIASAVALKEAAGSQMNGNGQSGAPGSDGTKKLQSADNIIRAAEGALRLEQERLKMFIGVEEKNHSLRSRSNEDFSRVERHIARLIRQIRGTKENVRSKANELIKIFKDPRCPRTISVATFAKKVVSHCESPDNAAFACGYVIVLVTSQVPEAMDLILAEFHKACIYTVPKHIIYSESAFGSKDAYYRTIGYREEDGKIEDVKDYLKRLESYMKLYGALVQTSVQGVQNTHGLKEGWAWIARLLNALPANVYTAIALNAFLEMAGFALFRLYKSQFMKILNIISEHFLVALRAREDSELKSVIVKIQSYIDDKKFLQEPEGRALQDSLLSSVMVPDYSDYQEPRYYY